MCSADKSVKIYPHQLKPRVSSGILRHFKAVTWHFPQSSLVSLSSANKSQTNNNSRALKVRQWSMAFEIKVGGTVPVSLIRHKYIHFCIWLLNMIRWMQKIHICVIEIKALLHFYSRSSYFTACVLDNSSGCLNSSFILHIDWFLYNPGDRILIWGQSLYLIVFSGVSAAAVNDMRVKITDMAAPSTSTSA